MGIRDRENLIAIWVCLEGEEKYLGRYIKFFQTGNIIYMGESNLRSESTKLQRTSWKNKETLQDCLGAMEDFKLIVDHGTLNRYLMVEELGR